MTPPNGEQREQPQEPDTLILTYNRATDHLDVGGHCHSLDLMLDMLSRAARVLKNQWRVERAKEFKAALQEEERTKAILHGLTNKR